MNDDVRTAERWYWWLWLSPLFTIPTMLYIFLPVSGVDREVGLRRDRGRLPLLHDLSAEVTAVVAVLASALWHLILLVPALNRQSEFVRWHGRQALLLAGVRTAIPAAFALYGRFYMPRIGCWSILQSSWPSGSSAPCGASCRPGAATAH